MPIDAEVALKTIEKIATTIENKKDYINELDSMIGDGDHGVNLTRGFRAVKEGLLNIRGKDIGTILKTVGSILLSKTGGAAGALYGTAFIDAGNVVEGKHEIDLQELVEMFEAGEAAIIRIGKAELGEKTMLDSVHPAVEALREAAKNNQPLIVAFEQCVKAAKKGAENTTRMKAKKGRAMYLGERTIGKPDVGAVSFCIMLSAALDTLKTSRICSRV